MRVASQGQSQVLAVPEALRGMALNRLQLGNGT